MAASTDNPLVTEWPASEKSHLQSLAASQTVAVQYQGCELRVIDGCRLEGSYRWQHTTLATDTVEISNADELYAKLPIGAVGLEAELQRSGRLAVRTTVSGQLRSIGITNFAPQDPACAGATHYVAGVSVGSFRLMSGTDTAGGGAVGIAGLGAGASTARREVTLREAGDTEACRLATDEAPHSQCASPLQVFLVPLVLQPGLAPALPPTEPGRGAADVRISFPAPEDSDELWTVRGPGGRVICAVPCEAWVGPVSGYYLQREPRNGYSQAIVRLPQSFAHPVGSQVEAEYQAERGNPQLATWALFGSIPTALMGAGLTTWGVVQATRTCEDDFDNECFPPAGFLLGTGIFIMAMGGAGIWWYGYSRSERFNTYEVLPPNAVNQQGVRLMLVPGGVSGTF